jgi:hypothetical protein
MDGTILKLNCPLRDFNDRFFWTAGSNPEEFIFDIRRESKVDYDEEKDLAHYTVEVPLTVDKLYAIKFPVSMKNFKFKLNDVILVEFDSVKTIEFLEPIILARHTQFSFTFTGDMNILHFDSTLFSLLNPYLTLGHCSNKPEAPNPKDYKLDKDKIRIEN